MKMEKEKLILSNKLNKIRLIKFLFKIYGSKVKSYGGNLFITLNSNIVVQVNVDKLEIVGIKNMYNNIDKERYSKIVNCINIIHNEIGKLKK